MKASATRKQKEKGWHESPSRLRVNQRYMEAGREKRRWKKEESDIVRVG